MNMATLSNDKRPKVLKILVDEDFIDDSNDEQRFSVPDISGCSSVSKKVALFHARNGALVFALSPLSSMIQRRTF
jgi:hypothetical protein